MSRIPNPATLQWDIEEVDLVEGSRFYNMRLEVRPNEFWNEGVLVNDTLENFRDLFRWLINEYRYDRIRVYFQHRDTYELYRVPNQPPPAGPLPLNFETQASNVLLTEAHVGQMAEAVYNQLIEMSDQYDEIDDDLIEQYVVIIDLHIDEQFGACGTGEFPAYFPPEYSRDTMYNPRGGNCALKCLYHYFRRCPPPNDDTCLDFARELGLPLDTETMLHDRLADTVYTALADDNLRIVVLDLQLNLKHCTGRILAEKTLTLMLSGKHYYLIHDLATLVKMRYGENAWLCFQCGKVTALDHYRATTEGGSVHECIRFQEDCQKCGKVFQTIDQRKYHRRKSRYGDFDSSTTVCDGCGERGFISKACYNHHVKNCQAYTVYRKNLDYEAKEQLIEQRQRMKIQREEQKERRAEERQAQRGKRVHCVGCGNNYYENSGTHTCYFERYEMPEEPKYPDGIYVFDFEAMFSDADAVGARAHSVNYVVVKKLFDEDFSQHFETVDEFVVWLDSISAEKALVLAHNFRGYDGRLLLAKLLETNSIVDEERTVQRFVTVASKLNSFKWGNLQFADSLLHIAQPLDQFPKIFGLDIECKGFFPYEFNVASNQRYVGEIPALEVFRPEKMSEKRREAFLRWYDEMKTLPYDFRHEMVKYCDLDVEIMKRGLEVYIRSAQMSCSNINPLESFTVASAAYRIWRTLHLPENVLSYYGASFHENARKSLRGGRTDVRCLYRSWTPQQVFVEKRYGVYADVQSMYPYIQMTKPLPVGRPVRIHNPSLEDFDGKLGIMKCTLLPPHNFQFHPAICVRDDESGRLCAPLRLKSLTGIFITTVEYEQARLQGYTTKSIQFVDLYEQSTELFRDYIRTFLKIKVEKSQDYPGDEKFRQLYDMYRERCGIELEAENFENNPGLKQIAKLYLNSLWGKLCERPKFDQTFHVSMDDFFKLEEEEELGIFEPKLKLKISQDSWLVRGTKLHQNRDNDIRTNMKKTSPALGSFITMYGRTMLLEQMQKLGKRVLYHDTDSIVYERVEGEYNIPLGKCLGDWEDELKGKPMIEFVALAPKTYSYRYLDDPVDETVDGCKYWQWEGRHYPIREVTKIKGVKQCFETKSSIDFDTMLALVNRTKDAIHTEQLLFSWNMREMKMTTRYIDKQTSFRYGKGVVGTDYFTYPPGVEQYWNGHSCEQGDVMHSAEWNSVGRAILDKRGCVASAGCSGITVTSAV